jgi:Ser-tRNA(Ala) deacylase AlaX
MSLCRKVFWDNPYLCRLNTKIVEVTGDEVLFDKTIAFSFSGGQESDSATFNQIPIISSRFDGLDIRYMFPPNHGFVVGDCGIMEIDWQRRNKLMRYHMLCELVLAITNKYFGKVDRELGPDDIDNLGIVKVMAKMSETGAYVDFDHDDLRPHIPALQSELDKIIAADLPIEKGFIDEANHERYWRIMNFAMNPCGGTHVRSTGELGPATLTRARTTNKFTESKKAERIKIKLECETPTVVGEH